MTFNFVEFKKLAKDNDSFSLALEYLKSKLAQAQTQEEKDQIFQSGSQDHTEEGESVGDIYNMVHYAVMLGSLELLQLLLDNGSAKFINDKAGVEGNTPLHIAAMLGKSEIVDTLLENGADSKIHDNNNRSVISKAARYAHTHIVSKLLSLEGVSVTENDKYNISPFHCAARSGNVNMMEMLLKQDPTIDINAEDNSGWTPLHYAASSNSKNAVEFLLSNGRLNSINTSSKHDITPLCISIAIGNIDVVKLLKEKGGDFIANIFGSKQTRLHIAAASGNKEIIEFVLEQI